MPSHVRRAAARRSPIGSSLPASTDVYPRPASAVVAPEKRERSAQRVQALARKKDPSGSSAGRRRRYAAALEVEASRAAPVRLRGFRLQAVNVFTRLLGDTDYFPQVIQVEPFRVSPLARRVLVRA